MASVTFNYTGAQQSWIVPDGVFSVVAECWGAQGGDGRVEGSATTKAGGKGGYAKGTLAVTPGETLYIYVGGTGGDYSTTATTNGGGGYNGGGAGAGSSASGAEGRAGGGGGKSDVRKGGTGFSFAKIVAGGGGGGSHVGDGGASDHAGVGGAGGAATGAEGGDTGADGGDGGTQSAGGAAGAATGNAGHTAGTNGSSGTGGTGSKSSGPVFTAYLVGNGGGGGGGYYGGGGGGSLAIQDSSVQSAGGGGGSNYVGGVSSSTSTRGVRSGHGLVKFTYSTTSPNPPTNVTPAAGASVSTDLPTLGATIGTHPGSSSTKQRAEWQLATDSGMTTNLRTITEPTSDQRTSGSTTEKVTGSDELFQGTWYIRARVIDEYGNVSTWTAAHSFTVAHAPSTTGHSPTGGITLNFGANGDVTLDWSFSDPSPTDVQTAYEIELSRNSDGTVLYTSTKQLSSDTSQLLSIDPAEKDNTLRWRVRVWDSDDVVSTWSDYHLFVMSDPPTIDITAPAEASTIDNGQPTIEWTFTASALRTQTAYRVTIRKTSNNSLVYDSGSVSSDATTHTPPSPVLDNLTNYTVKVAATGSEGLEGSDTNTFDTSWTPPAQPTANVFDLSPSSGYVLVEWDNTDADDQFVSYSLYRRLAGDTVWTKIYTTSEVASEYSYHDWFTKIGSQYEYALTQVATRFGANVESEIAGFSSVTPESDKYWLIHPDDESKNLMLQYVVGDDFSEEYEQEAMTVIGRGRHVDEGERLGFVGSLSAELRNIYGGDTAREQRLKINEMKANREALYLRNPFGDLWLVAMGDVGVSRVGGVGGNEYVDVDIPYMEVG